MASSIRADRTVKDGNRLTEIQYVDRRAANRVSDFMTLYGHDDLGVSSYIDLGTGDGSIGRAIADAIGAERVILADVKPIVGALTLHKNRPFPIDNASQQVATALVTIHHVTNISKWLNEVARIVRTNGLFYIREHDVTKNETAHYLNWVHLIDIILRNKNYHKEINEFYIVYYSKETIIRVLKSVGFTFVRQTVLPNPNPQRLYNALFQRGEATCSPVTLSGITFTLSESVNEFNTSKRLRTMVCRQIHKKLRRRCNRNIRFSTLKNAVIWLKNAVNRMN